MSTLTLIQPAGLGDLLLCQKIAAEMCRKFDRVYWPVIPHYAYIGQRLEHPANLFFEANPDYGEKLDLQGAGHQYPDDFMAGKYKLAGVKMDGWQDYVKIRRDEKAEAAILDLFQGAKFDFALVHDTYATPPQTFKARVRVQTALPEIYITMQGIPFDWIGLIEKAREIHFVDSVFAYLAELYARTDALYLYPRSQHTKKIVTKALWRKAWKYVEEPNG